MVELAHGAAGSRLARQIFLRSMTPARMPVSASSRLAEAMEDLYLPAGSVIYRQGEAPERIYFVVNGTVLLRADGTEDWVMNERSVIGVLDANIERPRARTAIASTDVHLLMMRSDDYYEMMEDNFEQTRAILTATTGGLRTLIDQLAPTGGFPEPPPALLEPDMASRLGQAEPPQDASRSRPGEVRSLNAVERIIALRGVSAFERASIQALTSLAEVIHEHRIDPGDVKQRAAGKERALYVVGRGAVQMIGDTPQLLATFPARTLVGGIGSLAEEPGRTRFVARAPSLLLELDIEDLYDVMEDHFDLARSLLAHGALERERLMLLIKKAEAQASSKSAPAVDTAPQQARP